MATTTAAKQRASHEEQLPVVAIGAAGDVTQVNDPARRILEGDPRANDVSLGGLVALLLQREPRSRGIVSFAVGHDSPEPPFTALNIVLSVQDVPGTPDEGRPPRRRPSPRAQAHAPDDCVVCRLRGPLETIQRVARGLRRDDDLQRHLDNASELELLEVEARRASLIAEGLLDPPPRNPRAAGRLSNVTTLAAASGIHRSSKYGLTHREVDVLRHVVEGQTDRGIAGLLSISTYTVNKHVANILGKMAAPSRTAAGVRAIREGIV